MRCKPQVVLDKLRKKRTKKVKKAEDPEKFLWNTLEEIAKDVTEGMEISDVLDFSIVSKTIETAVNSRIRSHFSNLQFKWLNPAEIDVNGQTVPIFDVISFIEYLATFKVIFLSADFQGFPEDGDVVRGIFEAVEQNSTKIINYRIENDQLVISHSSLTQICLEIQETGLTECQERVQEKFNGISPINTLVLELSSIGTSVYPKNVLKSILAAISPTTLDVVFSGSTEVMPPVLQYSDDYPKFEFISDSISLISPKNLQQYNVFYGNKNDACVPSYSFMDQWVTVTCYYTKTFIQFLKFASLMV